MPFKNYNNSTESSKVALTFDDVLIEPSYSTIESRANVSVPKTIIPANMSTITGVKMVEYCCSIFNPVILNRYASDEEIESCLNFIEKTECAIDESHTYFYTLDYNRFFFVAFSVGIIKNDEDKEKEKILKLLRAITNLRLNHISVYLCIDVAHGDHSLVEKTVKFIKEHSNIKVIAGNICTSEAALRLESFGVDIIKVGVGNGSLCTTRLATGCGYPQFQAILDIYNCLERRKKNSWKDIPIIADGGVRTPGDIAKAIGAGATYVMTGSMFAGTDMTPAVPGEENTYNGMASKETKEKYGLEDNFIEGVARKVTYKGKGSTQKVFKTIDDGLRSALSYAGIYTYANFIGGVTFNRVSPSTLLENHPHFRDSL